MIPNKPIKPRREPVQLTTEILIRIRGALTRGKQVTCDGVAKDAS